MGRIMRAITEDEMQMIGRRVYGRDLTKPEIDICQHALDVLLPKTLEIYVKAIEAVQDELARKKS